MAKRGMVPSEAIERRILLVRGQKVLLDRDLAELYGVTTKRRWQRSTSGGNCGRSPRGPRLLTTVSAAYSKRRRKDVQPVRRDLAELPRPWLAERSRDERPLARLPKSTGRMLRAEYGGKTAQNAASRGERHETSTGSKSTTDAGEEASPNVLSLRGLATKEPHPARRGERAEGTGLEPATGFPAPHFLLVC
jgi:hypothetical protein